MVSIDFNWLGDVNKSTTLPPTTALTFQESAMNSTAASNFARALAEVT